jgi:hypothetical protein
MIGKQSIARPTALGTLLQSSTYGATIPSHYGTPRGVPLPIWAANLRQGGSGKKLKNKKKGIVAYVENIDMLLGSNPITTILQIWANQSDSYPLDFKCYRFASNHGGSWNDTVTIPDAHFYAVIAVTIRTAIGGSPITFNDYGAPFPVTYYNASVEAVQCYEFPLWNAAQHGPDLSDPNVARFPYYIWAPSDGPTVITPEEGILERMAGVMMPNPSIHQYPFGQDFIYNIYYAATTSATKFQSPLARLRLIFESQLGTGDEYGDAGLGSQQIIYPPYAGIESSDIDLGSSAAIPSLRLEIQGSYGFLPSTLAGVAVYSGPETIDNVGARADAEFADIIEDLIKSGMMQYGAELGYIQRGCNCNDLPGPVQKNFGQRNGFWVTAPTIFPQPNTAGSILIAAGNSDSNFGSPLPTVDDTDGNSWLTALSDNAVGPGASGCFYVNGCIPSGGRNTVNLHVGGEGVDAFIMEMDPGSNTIDGAPVVISVPTGTTQQCSITTSGRPSYIVAIILSGGNSYAAYPTPQWSRLFPQAVPAWSNVYGRKVSSPGTYNLKVQALGLGSVYVVLFSLVSGQAAGTVPYPKALGNIVDYDSLFNVRLQCRAGGLQGSLAMDSQRKAADWLADLYECADAAPVWSGFKLKSIARSEVSVVGDGSLANVDSTTPVTFGGLASVYWAPTSLGPIVDLSEDDFIGDDKTPPVTVIRNAQADSNDIVQTQYFDRNNKYNQATASEPESGSIALYGPRKLAPKVLNMIVSSDVARKVNAISVRRRTYLRNGYAFKLHPKFIFLEAMDLVTITEPKLGINKLPVRLTKVVENDKYELECEAEPYIYGVHAPDILETTVLSPYVPNPSAEPADINTPIIFEPPLRMCLSGKPEVWFVVSDSDPTYGGCVVFVSTDGGSTYNMLGTITGNAPTGILTADFPASSDPDETNTLSVDLTESLGTLPTVGATDEANFTYPVYLEGSPIYELSAYQVPTLTATYKYDIVGSSGNPIRRGVFGMPNAGSGEDHPISPTASRFAYLDSREVASVPGILKVQLDPSWIGLTLNFKFVAFNSFGGGQQDISTLPDYTYAPMGIATATSGSGSTTGTTSQPSYTITGGALTQPTATTIHMDAATAQFPGTTVYYDARTFTITAPTAPTTYYVTIADPNQAGDVGPTPTLSDNCQTSNALVGVPGEVFIGSIVAIPAGGGVQSGSGGFPTPPSDLLTINFIVNDGSAGTNIGPELPAPHAGTVSRCKVVTKASDASVDLTFKIKQNGVDVFSSDPTVAHGTAGGTLSTFTALTSSPLPVADGDIFTIDITSGSSAWICTILLET